MSNKKGCKMRLHLSDKSVFECYSSVEFKDAVADIIESGGLWLDGIIINAEHVVFFEDISKEDDSETVSGKGSRRDTRGAKKVS